jgi:hypothetical protein
MRATIFNINMFFSSRGYIGGLKKYANMEGGGARGDKLAHGLIDFTTLAA